MPNNRINSDLRRDAAQSGYAHLVMVQPPNSGQKRQLLCNVFGFGGPGLGSLRALGSQRLT